MSDYSSAAPGQLELVRAFVNTLDPDTGADALARAAGLRAWLAERGLLAVGTRVSATDARRARTLREALRALLCANNGEPSAPDAAAVLDEAARAARLCVAFPAEGGARLEARASGVRGALGGLLAIVAEAMSEQTWERLKACRASTCLWAYYDRSKNHSRTWCSMAVCGNRTKVRAFRRRGAQ